MKKKVLAGLNTLIVMAVLNMGAISISAANVPSGAVESCGHYYKLYDLGSSWSEAVLRKSWWTLGNSYI